MSVSKLISPLVTFKENDLSFIGQGVQNIGAALIGLCSKGPAFQPTLITDFNQFREIFGDLDTQLYTPYAAKAYLANSNTLTVTRLLSDSTQNFGAPLLLAFGATTGIPISGSNTAMAVLRFRADTGVLTASMTGSPGNFALNIRDVVVSNLSLDKTSPNYIKKVLGTNSQRTKSGDLLPSVYVDAVFDYAYSATLASQTGSISANSNFWNQIIGGYTTAVSPTVVSQNYNGSVYDLFDVYSRTDGDASNYDVKVSILVDQSQVSISSYPQFTVFVRDYNDTDSRPTILESFRCDLDPTSNTFIGKVIGDRYITVDNSTDPPTLKVEGQYNNNSKFIRVDAKTSGDSPLYPTSAKPSGFKGVAGINPTVTMPQLPYKTDHVSTLTNTKNDKTYMGVDFAQDSVKDRIKGSIVSVSGAKTNDRGLLTFSMSAEYWNNSGTATLLSTYTLVPSWGPSTDSSSSVPSVTSTYQKNAFTFPLVGGSDGFDPRSDLRELTNGSLSTEYNYMVSLLGNADEYDFNLIALPGINAGNSRNGGLPQRVIDMVTDRGDAFYIMDIADSSIASTSGAVDSTIDGVVSVANSYDSNYAAAYFPWVRIMDTDSQRLVWVPPSVDVLGVYAFNDKVGQQWFAPGGFNRGIMSAVEARLRLNITQRDTLYASKINPIATFSGQGPVVWGQKTLQTHASALDRVNVRRLLIVAKKLIASVAKYYAFEPNTATTRDSLTNQINPILKTIQEKQGIDQFRVVIDETNNTSDIVDRNILIGTIYIVPARTAEILQFSFNILRTGQTLFET